MDQPSFVQFGLDEFSPARIKRCRFTTCGLLSASRAQSRGSETGATSCPVVRYLVVRVDDPVRSWHPLRQTLGVHAMRAEVGRLSDPEPRDDWSSFQGSEGREGCTATEPQFGDGFPRSTHAMRVQLTRPALSGPEVRDVYQTPRPTSFNAATTLCLLGSIHGSPTQPRNLNHINRKITKRKGA